MHTFVHFAYCFRCGSRILPRGPASEAKVANIAELCDQSELFAAWVQGLLKEALGFLMLKYMYDFS